MHHKSTVFIPVTGGHLALIDADDAVRVSARKWRLDSDGYVISGGKQTNFKLHRFVLNAPKGVAVDHVNQDKLDNRKVNLRYVTHSQNVVHAPLRHTNTSGYKGVTWHKRTQTWRAYIRVAGRQIHIGHYDSAQEAARAYDTAAVAEWGEFAYRNFPE
jgi:hypothetical protein